MSNFYKNTFDFTLTPDPKERRDNITKEIVRHADYMPKTVSYEDIDRAFKEWVETKISIIQDGVELPTMVLYSNQRFSEYMQTWKYTDENNNVRLNFKTVTRESNPNHGTIVGETYNIPGDRFYNFKSIHATDENGKKYRLDYKMKQPTAVDLIYKITIMTNRYTTLNDFNETINKIFNGRQSYICPNGHYMSILLENISDESEYNIEDRQFFSQNFTAKVRGYILKEDDFKVEENPIASIICFEGDTAKRRKPTIELYEYDPCFVEEEQYFHKPIEIDVDLSFCYPCHGKTSFTMDEDFILTEFVLKEPNNIQPNYVQLYVNGELVTSDLQSDAYEAYVKCENIPEDATKTNTFESEEMLTSFKKGYKYILYNGEYYSWHQIHFSVDDEIHIVTKRINRYKNTGGFILKGYNRFINYPFYVETPEASIDEENLVFETTNITITPSEECII
jgi:hypothetical protein